MEFTINKKLFLDALTRTQSVVERRNTMQILSNVCLVVENGQLAVCATDLEVAIRVVEPLENSKNGSTTILAKNLIDIVREFPDRPIEFKTTNNHWSQLKSGKIQFQIVSTPSDSFPLPRSSQVKNWVEIDSKEVSTLIGSAAYCMSQDETRYFMNGLFFDMLEKNYRVVATDGWRLTYRDAQSNPFKSILPKGVIVPRKGVAEWKRLLDSTDGPVQIGVEANNLWVKAGSAELSIRLIDGEYPEYKDKVPKKFSSLCKVQKDALVSALRRVGVIANDKSRDVKFLFNKGSLTISTTNPDFGEAVEDLESTYEGQPLEMRFNSKFVIEAVQYVPDEIVAIQLNESLAPALFTGANNKDYIAIVMPMRL